DLRALRTGGMVLATRPITKRLRWAASATLDREQVTVDDHHTITRGHVSIVELAGDVQYERHAWRLDGAAGLAIPIGVGADPWPEAKLVAKWRPTAELELAASAGRKGRVPSLRER